MTLNGTRTPAGWASYFLDHAANLPGHSPALFTDAMCLSSMRLTAYLAYKYGIPADRRHIVGHDGVPHPDDPNRLGGVNGHGDPGPHLDWERYVHHVRTHLVVIGGG